MKEDGKIYEILVLEKGNITYNELELLVGPFLLMKKNDVFLEKWENEITSGNEFLINRKCG